MARGAAHARRPGAAPPPPNEPATAPAPRHSRAPAIRRAGNAPGTLRAARRAADGRLDRRGRLWGAGHRVGPIRAAGDSPGAPPMLGATLRAARPDRLRHRGTCRRAYRRLALSSCGIQGYAPDANYY